MAVRKPSSKMIENSAPQNIAKDIYGAIKDIASPWLGTPPAQNKQVTQAQGLARAAAETLDQTVAGGMIKAGVEGDRALVKQAAVNAAALGAGYVAGKAVQTAVQSGKASGVGARVVNKVIGREVWVHASPTSNLPKINPVVAPGGRPRYGKNESLTFGVRVGAKGTKSYMSEYSREISTKYSSFGAVAPAGKPVSVYVTTVPKKGIVGTEATGKWGISSMPQKVVSEINLAGKTATQVEQSIVSAARRAGQSPRPEYNAVEKLRMELARRRFVKNNPVKKNLKRID